MLIIITYFYIILSCIKLYQDSSNQTKYGNNAFTNSLKSVHNLWPLYETTNEHVITLGSKRTKRGDSYSVHTCEELEREEDKAL